MRFTVAIDGPAAAGKGTISKAVAARFGFTHLDTGLLYRAVGRRTLNGEDAVAASRSLTAEELNQGDLRTADIAQAASKVAVIPEVRAALVDFQRAFARRAGGAVLDGRDIGTVICPEAEVKLFVTASAEVRAARRFLELREKSAEITREQVLQDVRERDERDAARSAAPMIAADDAVLLDTSNLSIDDALERAVSIVNQKLPDASE